MESLRYKHRRPTHPGKIIREDILPVLGFTMPELSRKLGITRRVLNDLINERGAVTADMAIKLSRVIGRTPAGWLKMQQAVDLWDIQHTATDKTIVKKLPHGVKRKAS